MNKLVVGPDLSSSIQIIYPLPADTAIASHLFLDYNLDKFTLFKQPILADEGNEHHNFILEPIVGGSPFQNSNHLTHPLLYKT